MHIRTIEKAVFLTLLGSVFAFAPTTRGQSDVGGVPKDALLILDASGSMWGQIDGVNKIVIAKDVLEELVLGLPEEQRLGLVVYGHRRKGDCKDIQTLADVGANREDVIKQLRAVSPRGKTPLTASVEHAAKHLNYRKKAATVVLVSDGLETCDADPCALARLLEENGLDFTVHVVGFDVTTEEREGLQCIADETGGSLLTADNAEQLTEALFQIAAVNEQSTQSDGESDPAPSTLALKATILSGGPLIQSDLDWTVTPAAGGDPVFRVVDAGFVQTAVVPGDYVAQVTWTGWTHDETPKTARVEFSVRAQQPRVLTVPINLGIPVTLDAPDSTPEGVAFDVTWSGPDDLGAYIHVSGVEDGPRDYAYGWSTSKVRGQIEAKAQDKASLDTDGDGDFDQDDKATAPVGGPSIAGAYEVRYVLDQPRLILARRPLTVSDSQYTLDAPNEAAVSTSIEIGWDGPLTDGDFVTLIEAGSKTVFKNGVTDRLIEGQSASLVTPATPGQYEVRYILANGYTLYPGMQHAVQASTPITIVDSKASVSGPSQAVGGSTIDVRWEGPAEDWQDDYVSIIQPGAEKYNRDSWTKLTKHDEPVSIEVPNIDGEYEIAYFLQPGQRAIARQPITITRAPASIDAPASVKVGEDFEVAFSGPGYKGDRVVITPIDEPDQKMWGWTSRYGFAVATGVDGKGTVKNYAFAQAGEYEARYVTGKQHQVLARDAFMVTE